MHVDNKAANALVAFSVAKVSTLGPEPVMGESAVIGLRAENCVVAESLGVTAHDGTLLLPTTFSLEKGQCLAVTGANGSGKTTLLRVLAGVKRPSSGRASVAGLEVNERDRRFRRAVAGQIGSAPIARDLTLEEHLSLVGVSWGSSTASARNRARTLLDECEIGRLSERFPHELSSGQSQLFSFALTLARPFDVLLLDEPEQRLDRERLALITRKLRALIDGGTTVIIASHNASLIDAVATKRLALSGATG